MNQHKYYAQNDSGGQDYGHEDENPNEVDRFALYPEQLYRQQQANINPALRSEFKMDYQPNQVQRKQSDDNSNPMSPFDVSSSLP